MIETRNKEWRNNQSGFGYRLLTKMGWAEGNGLGKQKQGSLDVIAVSKRSDSLGLGAIRDQMGNHAWSETSSSYQTLLDQLRGKYSTKNNSTEALPNDAPADSETKAQKSVVKKKEEEGTETKQTGERKIVTKVLSHHKVLKSKNVSLYSQEDLAAILGLKYDPKTQLSKVESIERVESSISLTEVVEPSKNNKHHKKKKDKRKREEQTEAEVDEIEDHDDEKEQRKKRKQKKKNEK